MRRRSQANLAQAIDGTPFRPDTFAPFLTDVEAARTPDRCCNAQDLNGTSLALRLDSLLVQASGHWLAMLPLRGVSDRRAVADRRSPAMTTSRLVFLDLKAESDRLLGTLSARGADTFARRQHRHRRAAVDQPAIASADRRGAAAAGGRGDLHRRAAADRSGPAVDLQSVRTAAGRRGRFQLLPVLRAPLSADTDDLARRRMVASLVIADLCTVIGFGILSFSAIPVLHGIGLTVAIGACLSLLFGAILSAQPTAAADWTSRRGTVNGHRDGIPMTQSNRRSPAPIVYVACGNWAWRWRP